MFYFLLHTCVQFGCLFAFVCLFLGVGGSVFFYFIYTFQNPRKKRVFFFSSGYAIFFDTRRQVCCSCVAETQAKKSVSVCAS